MNNIIAIVLILASVGLFYEYVAPTYEDIKTLRTEKVQYDEALMNSKKVADLRDELLSKYNNFAPNDIKRIEKLLPDRIDNVRLIIEVDSIASRHDMTLKDVTVSVSGNTPASPSGAFGDQTQVENIPYGTATFSFAVSGSYEEYRSLLKDIEKSLRITDIRSVSVTAVNTSPKDSKSADFFDFKTIMDTYWLKQE